MKEATKTIIELAINNDDQIDARVAETIKQALVGKLPVQEGRRARPTGEPMLLKLNDAAKKLGVSRVTFWRLVHSGAIRPVEIFEGVFRYSYEDLIELSQQRTTYRPKLRGVTKDMRIAV
ncbi:MAG: helix-turn-helix domain-containing protein [Verrucomicrobiota bacterium JB024]|nr:helix-turn-helix domain-containing protein [Verrucomicrobiota bacterium JB024]